MIDNIYDCFAQNICKKNGNPSGWNENTYKTNAWNGKHILCIGSGYQSYGNGVLVDVPQGTTVLYLRFISSKYNTFRVVPYNNVDALDEEKYQGGYRNLLSFTPYGGVQDFDYSYYEWIAIPIRE